MSASSITDTPAALKAARGRELIRAVPADAATAEAVLTSYPAATKGDGGAFLIEAGGEAFAENFLKQSAAGCERTSPL